MLFAANNFGMTALRNGFGAINGVAPLWYADFENGRYARNGQPVTQFKNLSFTRAGAARYVAEDLTVGTAPINEPRFDWRTGKRRLLVENTATNTVLYSKDYTNDIWEKANGMTVTPNSVVSPDGVTLADSLNVTGSSTGILYQQSLSVVAGTTLTFSYYVKKGTSINYLAVYNNTDASFIVHPVVSDAYVTQTLANGWARVACTFVVPEGCENVRVYPHRSFIGVPASYGSVAVWGAQLEENNAASSYIDTTSGAVTRAGDHPLSDISEFDLDDGLWLVLDGLLWGELLSGDRLFELDGGSEEVNRLITVLSGSSTQARQFYSGGYASAVSPYSLPAEYSIACRFSPGNLSLVLNGTLWDANVPSGYAAPTTLRIADAFPGQLSVRNTSVLGLGLYPASVPVEAMKARTAQ
ncbi:phage head spike fiber domain-containing protein [Pseudooceanicola sediminis]|nr:hypothetical protein [Pseudooceanicola sediminis]